MIGAAHLRSSRLAITFAQCAITITMVLATPGLCAPRCEVPLHDPRSDGAADRAVTTASIQRVDDDVGALPGTCSIDEGGHSV